MSFSFRRHHFWLAGVILLNLCAQPALAGTTGLVQSSGDAYWIGADGNRSLFAPQDEALKSWSMDMSAARSVEPVELASHPLAGIVRFCPGTLAKVATSNQLYAVGQAGLLRPIPDRTVAAQLFPKTNPDQAPTIGVAQFTNYRVGVPVETVTSFDPAEERVATPDENPLPPPIEPPAPPKGNVTQKTFAGTLILSVAWDENDVPTVRAELTDMNSPAQSIKLELVNQSNIPIRICESSAVCEQALMGDFATNVQGVRVKASNELGQMVMSELLPIN